jgi:GT2 family glycosyltransferase
LRLEDVSELQRQALAGAAALEQRLREEQLSSTQRIAELEAQVLDIERVRAAQYDQHDRERSQLHLRLEDVSELQRQALAGAAALEQRLREEQVSSTQRIAELEASLISEARQRVREVEVAKDTSQTQMLALQAELHHRISDQIAHHREITASINAAYEAERDRREAEVRAEINTAEEVIATLRSDLMRTQGVARERGRLLEQLIRQNHEIRSSTLWRLVGPARWLGSKVPMLSTGSRFLRSAAKRLVRGPVSDHPQTASLSGAADGTMGPIASLKTSSRISVDPEPIARLLVAEHCEQEYVDGWRRHCVNFPLPIDPASSSKPNLELSDSEADEWIRRCMAEGDRLPPLKDAPKVSIIIPVYNQLAFTLSAVASVYAQKTKYSYEILVGDDGSTDQTRRLDDFMLPRVRLVRHERNVGFIQNCNLTAEKAQGEFLVLLNNDTVVLPGWLDELVDTLKSDESIGLVGSKLLYANATLQEAGGIVWQDGSAWNWGRNQDPRDPRYSYAREVDYCSGASIAISARVWRELGGFDGVTFENSYYEDVDLAFRVREAGLKVVYQPLSSIVHFEGITSGVDVTGGTKKYQVLNGARFFARWRQTLKLHRPNGVEPVKEAERRVMGRLLILDAVTPTPDRDAGSLVMMEMISAFQDCGWRVSFIPEDNFAHLPVVTHRLQRNGIEALYWPHFQSVDEILEKRASEFDIVVISRAGPAAKHLRVVRRRAPQAKIIFNTVDLHFLREQREARLSGSDDALQKAAQTKVVELQSVSDSDLTIVHSTVERDILQQEMPEATVAVFPWVATVVPPTGPLASREAVLFVGSFQHAPNADGLRWFFDAIWPRVRAEVPHAKFNIVGAEAPEDIQKWHGRDGVSVLGWLQDLDPQLNRARVSVAPLRFGAGVKGKVVSALSRGLPVVCTSIAAEGMGLRSGVEVIVADEPEEFARSIIMLLREENAWFQLSRNGLRFVEDNYSRETARRLITEMVSRIGL